MLATERRTIAGFALLVGLFGSDRPVGAATGEPIEIQVAVINRAEVPAAELASAQREVEQIYRNVGVSVVWIGTSFATGERRFVVHIVRKPPKSLGRTGEVVLGLAPGSKEVRARRVWAFYDRIRDLAVERAKSRSLLLGLVIAHEIGHVLLPHDSHTLTGLMSSGWDAAALASAQRGLLTFAPHQVSQIHSRLQTASLAAVRR